MSRNWQQKHLGRHRPPVEHSAEVDTTEPRLTCEGCFQAFHPDAVDGNEDGWACTECDTWHDKDST